MKRAALRLREVNVEQRQTDADRRDRFDERADRFHRFDDAHGIAELETIAVCERSSPDDLRARKI